MSRRLRLSAVGLGLAIWLSAISCGAAANEGLYPLGLPPTARVDRLVVFKSAHRMEAWSEETLLRTYTVSVGTGGAGDKNYEGDGRTPEGRYRIDRRHRSREFHRFLHVSYPNREDRRRYRRARSAGEIPQGRGIGSAIGIHGSPGFRALRLFNWTAGCIAVSDEEAEELYRAVIEDAEIEILP